MGVLVFFLHCPFSSVLLKKQEKGTKVLEKVLPLDTLPVVDSLSIVDGTVTALLVVVSNESVVDMMFAEVVDAASEDVGVEDMTVVDGVSTVVEDTRVVCSVLVEAVEVEEELVSTK